MTNNTMRLLDEFESKFPKGQVKIYQTEQGLKKQYKLECSEHWLSIGQSETIVSGEKRDFHLTFDVFEAKKYGFIIDCNYEGIIPGYPNLSCDPKELIEMTILEKIEAVGYEESSIKYSCPNCSKQWIIDRTFDSMRGFYRKCREA